MLLRTRIKYLILGLTVGLFISSLSAFVPQRRHFINDYQHQLFMSWMQRSGFDPNSPASLSHQVIKITYLDRVNDQKVTLECDMQNQKIINLRESIASRIIMTESPDLERQYRYYMEMLLFRLNSDQLFFVKDLLKNLDIEMSLGEENEENKVFLKDLLNRDRLRLQEVHFTNVKTGSYRYRLRLASGEILDFIFPDQASLPELASLAVKESYYVAETVTKTEDILHADTPEEDKHTLAHYHVPGTDIYEKPAVLRPSRTIPDRTLSMQEFLTTYREKPWGREMLHNKIENPHIFLSAEFPNHELSQSQTTFDLTTIPFRDRDHISGDISLVKKSLRDGMNFEAHEQYTINSNRSVTLSTGESISLSELHDREIAIISPYLSQLITMHRVMGTKLLNFLLIPADVPTTLVLRDPERWVSEFPSYTDLVLMLSHYWQDRLVYFGIEKVKKVNNYIELNGFLAAVQQEDDSFDFAEVKFALSSSYRIDFAMITLYTNISGE